MAKTETKGNINILYSCDAAAADGATDLEHDSVIHSCKQEVADKSDMEMGHATLDRHLSNLILARR